MKYIYMGMGWILKQLYLLLQAISPYLGNYAIAIVVFTILVTVVFLPVNINQQKTTAKQTAIRPKMDALKKKYGNDQQKYQMAVQELNQREGIKMMAGCLPQLIKLPFLWGVWMAIRSPLSYITGAAADQITAAKNYLIANIPAFSGKSEAAVTELDVLQHVNSLGQSSDANVVALVDKYNKAPLDFNLFGLDLTQTPSFTLNFASVTGPQLALWIIPLLAFATSMMSSVVMMRMQKKTNPEAASMGLMMYLMPLLSMWIAFTVPAAVGFYWACSNVVTMIIQIVMNRHLGPYKIIAREERKLIAERRKKESELKAKNSASAAE